MSDAKVQASSGISFLGLLTVLFIGLKLTGYITWSWLWVLSPLWLPTAIVLTVAAVIFTVCVLIAVFCAALAKILESK